MVTESDEARGSKTIASRLGARHSFGRTGISTEGPSFRPSGMMVHSRPYRPTSTGNLVCVCV